MCYSGDILRTARKIKQRGWRAAEQWVRRRSGGQWPCNESGQWHQWEGVRLGGKFCDESRRWKTSNGQQRQATKKEARGGRRWRLLNYLVSKNNTPSWECPRVWTRYLADALVVSRSSAEKNCSQTTIGAYIRADYNIWKYWVKSGGH